MILSTTENPTTAFPKCKIAKKKQINKYNISNGNTSITDIKEHAISG